VDIGQVARELPVGEATVLAVEGGLRVPGADTLIACAGITVCVEEARGEACAGAGDR
jgi:hypothetical protein